MNYLAHLALSGDQEDIIFGNFIGDAVKGKSVFEYKADVKKGILLHRHIDTFTDQHPVYLASKRKFYGKVEKLSGVVTDILYDFLLCECWAEFYSSDISGFITKVYAYLDTRIDQMPIKMQFIYSHMRKHDWLTSYKDFSGIEMAVNGIGRRTKLPINARLFHDTYFENEILFKEEFLVFYSDLKKSVDDFLVS